ncbi:Calx-beta domain-containing protein, partial [Microcystis sp. M046S2]|uniref:Calx-beta domain-containing protein n=1 Tax=Microcystis sp. M046S2 TaxID=2771168 RepID=UPI002583D2CC
FAKVVLNQPLTEAEITRLKTENDQAVVVIDGQSVQIEQAITLVGKWDYLSYAHGVTVVGNYAYAVGDTLEIIDISNPSNPVFKGNYDIYSGQDVQIVGNYAYVADSWSGLQIIDISNPAAPTLKGNYGTSGTARDVQIVGNYAYVADLDSGLQIIDIINPAAPTFKGNYDTSGYAYGVQIVGNYAYVADYEGGLQILDVSDFTNPSTSTVTLAVSPSSVTEDGTTNLVYTFTRSGVTTNPLTVNYTIGGTATNGTDYTSIPTSVTFAANSATATVIVDPTADTTVESDETVALTLATGTGYTVGTTTAVTGTILNDDLPSITLAVSPSSVTDDGTANLVYTFTRSGVTTNALTVNYTLGGTATLNTDYTRTGTTNTITVAANSATATVIVDPTADTTVESNETVALTLATGTGYTVGTPNAATGTILNDDLPSITLAVSPSSVTEDGTANLVYTFTRSGVTTNALTVNYTLGGTATNGTDYTSIPTSVTFAANSATATVIVDPTADTTVEPDETVALTLATGTGYTVGTPNTVTGTITNDDTSVTLAVSPTSVTEDGTANLVYTFTRSGVTTNALTVNYTLGGTATLNTDYTRSGTNNTVTFAAGSSTATVIVDPTADTTVESNETVALTLATGTGYTVGTPNAATGTITNDDVTLPSITLSLNYSGISESSPSNFVYTFTRTGVTTNALTVNYNIAGTASATDYTGATPGNGKTITFNPGSTTTSITIEPTADTVVEPNETISLQLAAGTGYSIGTTAAQIATIINDDGTRRHVGTNGKDVLLGTNANDYLIGGAGDDILTGGTGGDIFYFASSNLGNDAITDFTPGQDFIQVSRQGFGGGLIAGDTITQVQFLIGSSATNASQRFIYNSTSGAWLF